MKADIDSEYVEHGIVTMRHFVRRELTSARVTFLVHVRTWPRKLILIEIPMSYVIHLFYVVYVLCVRCSCTQHTGTKERGYETNPC